MSHRSQISIDKFKNNSKGYIYDLNKTWELNIELINNIIKKYSKENTDFKQIITKIKILKDLYSKKHEKRKILEEKRGKILIDKQITEEYCRKLEENNDIFREQIKETQENINNKEEYIKLFEKKLKEVEIYIQKHTKTIANCKFEFYKNFKMNNFINENTFLLKNKQSCLNLKKNILTKIEEIKRENNKLVLSHTLSFNLTNYLINDPNSNNKNISIKNSYNLKDNRYFQGNRINFSSILPDQKRFSIKCVNNNLKFNEIIIQYNNKINAFHSKNKLMIEKFNDLKSKCANSNLC